MDKNKIGQNIRALRMVLSFALLGAVLAGTFFGGSDGDLRPYGALFGAAGAVSFKLLHIL
jgi:hypothetical protein